MKTILQEWQSYDEKVIPKDAPTVQREECRRAFYAGAAACFWLVLAATVPVDEDECEENLRALQAELEQFPRDLRIA